MSSRSLTANPPLQTIASRRVRSGICAKLLALLTAFAVVGLAHASDPTNGSGFVTLAHPQAAGGSSKIEVVELFSYHCVPCNALDPLLSAWAARHRSEVSLIRMHAVWGERGSSTERSMRALQRTFYTLTALGKEERLRKKLFDAVQDPRTALFSDAALRAYVVKQGIDGTAYDEMANSFAVQSKMQRALLLMGKYQLSGVPNLVVDGRFVTSPALASRGAPRADAKKDNPATLHVLDDLLARVKAERPAPPAAVPTHAPTARAKPRVLPRRHPTAHLRTHR